MNVKTLAFLTDVPVRSQLLASRRLYKVWKQDGDAGLAEVGSHSIDEAVKAGAGQVETLELGHRYGHLSPLVAVA